MAADSIAAGAALVLEYRPIVRRVAGAAGVSPKRVRETLATKVQPGGGIEIRATGEDAASAARLANAAADVLVSYLRELDRADSSGDRLLRQYVTAAAAFRLRADRASRLERRLGRGGSPAQVARLTEAVRETEIARVRRDSLREAYATDGRVTPGDSAQVEVVARARGADSDRASQLRRLLILALGAGLLAGLCLASLQANSVTRAFHASRRTPAGAAGSPSPVKRRVLAGTAALLVALLAGAVVLAGYGFVTFAWAGALIGAAAVGYLLWQAAPWVTISIGIVLTPFSGKWELLGFPGGYVAPDRILLLGGILAALLRGPRLRDRRAISWRPTHLFLVAASLYVVGSALIAGTLFQQEPLLELVEAFGLLPFLVFVVAPFVFATEARRQALLASLVGLGAYLGLTALFETTHVDPLVWPQYINDPGVGIHFGRARGPFTEAVTNGTGLFATGTAAVIALGLWKSRLARCIAGCVVLLCLIGLLFTLQRSVWLGGIVSMLVVGVAMRELRPFVVPAAVIGALLVIVAFAGVPNLQDQAEHRAAQQETIWDRDNLNRAAWNMVAARPLTGFGWATFKAKSRDYFRQKEYPLTGAGAGVHNVYLGYASTLGLIGVTLWALGVLTAITAALRSRGPDDLRLWRFGFLGYATFFLIVSSFVPPQVFPNLMLWAWAGLLWSGCVAQDSGAGPRVFRMPAPEDGGTGGASESAVREPMLA